MKWLISLMGLAWLPHSLERSMRLGYDFSNYYNYAKTGQDFCCGNNYGIWFHPSFYDIFFKPLTLFPIEVAFCIFYTLCVWAWIAIVKDSIFLFVLSLYPMLLCLELGQTAPILAWLCLSPLGAMFATTWKPYLVIFVIIHFWRKYGLANSQSR